MARGISRSTPPAPLPTVQFEKIEDDVSTQPSGVGDGQARSYGYNDFSDFKRPDNYIHYIEPLESDLATQVEYDMDEQDKEWLDAVNEERWKDQLNRVSYETFEVIMDRLEKEWFDLTKNIPKPDALALPSEDSTCAVCDDSEGENSNAIVFCDGCNLAVHQDCYGVPYIPEGQWLCRKCTVSPENPVSCILCPNEGGAFKQTVNGEWVHLLCAIWVPETRVVNDVFMEPVTGVEKISKQRWKLKCSACDVREGACIQCAKSTCFLAFHTTCARKERLLLPMKTSHSVESVKLTAYCERHLPKEQQEIRAAALAAEEEIPDVSTKSARAYAKTYKPGPPLAPAIIVQRIEKYIDKIKVRKPSDFISLVCRYWSLKREARRGAPLLKRLHLEPWTAANKGHNQTEEEKAIKLEQLLRLKSDLERLRGIAELTRKRESRKLVQVEILQDVLSRCLFSHEPPLRMAFEKIIGVDRNDYFKSPVTKSEAPDYFDVIKKPMCWSVIDVKLDRHEYWDLQAFKDDIQLVIDNAMLYNKPDTKFHKTALKIQAVARPLFEELAQLSTMISRDVESEPIAEQSNTAGDLEPPLSFLDLLFSTNAIEDSINLVLQSDPISSLISYEFAVLKPPPPPPQSTTKKKKGHASTHERMSADSSGAEGEAPSSSSSLLSISIPRTRRAAAAAAAFEAEANIGIPDDARQLSEDQDATPLSELTKESSKKVPNKKPPKSTTTASPQPLEGPRVVEGIGNKDSFDMFETGWILPPDQKRGGRARLPPLPMIPSDRGTHMPPKKKVKLDHKSSTLSLSTGESENQTLQESKKLPESAMDLDGLDPMTDIIPPGRIVKSETGTMIIEELDTPAIRREKARRRKLLLAESSQPPISTSSFSAENMEVDQHSILSELSDLKSGREERGKPGESFQDGGTLTIPDAISSSINDELVLRSPTDKSVALSDNSKTTKSKKRTSGGRRVASAPSANAHKVVTRAGARSPAIITLKEGEKLEGGTLVWGKSPSYPWWPGIIFEEDDEEIPPNVYEGWVEMKKEVKGPLFFVRYYDKAKTWSYLPPDKLLLLNEDKEVDEDLLASNSQRQRWTGKQAKNKKPCREAYREAIQEMETPSDMADKQGNDQTPATDTT